MEYSRGMALRKTILDGMAPFGISSLLTSLLTTIFIWHPRYSLGWSVDVVFWTMLVCIAVSGLVIKHYSKNSELDTHWFIDKDLRNQLSKQDQTTDPFVSTRENPTDSAHSNAWANTIFGDCVRCHAQERYLIPRNGGMACIVYGVMQPESELCPKCGEPRSASTPSSSCTACMYWAIRKQVRDQEAAAMSGYASAKLYKDLTPTYTGIPIEPLKIPDETEG